MEDAAVISERVNIVITALTWLNDPMKLKQLDKKLLRQFRELISEVRKTAWNVEQWSS